MERDVGKKKIAGLAQLGATYICLGWPAFAASVVQILAWNLAVPHRDATCKEDQGHSWTARSARRASKDMVGAMVKTLMARLYVHI